MLKSFIRNEDGNYAIIFTLMMVPIMGAVGMSVDFSNVSRLKYDLSESVDSAGIAVSKAFQSGVTDRDALEDLADKFVYGNFDEGYKESTAVKVVLPSDEGNTTKELIVRGTLTYKTLFGPVLAALTGTDKSKYVVVIEEATLKLRTLAEIALVLDNSGSMSDSVGGGTRMDLLKSASKDLMSNIFQLGAEVSQVTDPVKFAIVPFAGSVNVGADKRGETWIDNRGISPVHHEHLNWGAPSATNPTGLRSIASDGAKLDASGNPLTRLSILDNLRFMDDGIEQVATANCAVWRAGLGTSISAANSTTANCAVFTRINGTARAATSVDVAAEMGTTTTALTNKYAWTGCVEARPYPYSVQDTPAGGAGASYFVPWFAPDEYNNQRYGIQSNNSTSTGTTNYNNWWPDNDPATVGVNVYPTNAGSGAPSSMWQTGTGRPRETDVAKYFQKQVNLRGSGPASTVGGTRKGQWHYFKGAPGPNAGCTTTPITTLTTDQDDLNDAIDAMQPLGSTNVTEGLAWGWRVVSSTAPFTQGKAETRKDIDKVVIVLTDGKNTYYTPSSLGYTDYAANKSIYSTHGYPGWNGNTGTNGIATQTSPTNPSRIADNTAVSSYDYTNNKYTEAMIAQMGTLCTNVKAAKVVLMTIALDLDVVDDAAMISGLKSCAGDSRSRSDADGNKEKLFWNACASEVTPGCKPLSQVFEEVGDELSNLRFTG